MPAMTPEAVQLRQERRPTPVRLHHVPQWFRLKLMRRFGVPEGYGGPCSGTEALYHAQGRLPALADVLDHWGSTRLPDGQVAFVCEPYRTVEELRAAAVAVAAELRCGWSVSADSEWYPGQTVRVLFLPSPVAGRAVADDGRDLPAHPISQCPCGKRWEDGHDGHGHGYELLGLPDVVLVQFLCGECCSILNGWGSEREQRKLNQAIEANVARLALRLMADG